MSSSNRSLPDLSVERRLLRSRSGPLCALDEVGRGALAGPVLVGAVLIAAECGPAPVGVRDSKLLTPATRERLRPEIEQWVSAWGVGQASASEIDRHGIIGALRLAALRAISSLGNVPGIVLLDGNHDWLSSNDSACPEVVTMVKADLHCTSVAAASVLAKVRRDELMRRLSKRHPVYDWEHNKGYASPKHTEALTTHGVSVQHRRSWQLPGIRQD